MPPNALDPKILLEALAEQRLLSCIGVPDSTLEPVIAVLRADARFSNLTATNECEAVSIAMGEYVGSGEPSVVYLQNSGFGKTIHPITSLLTREICSVPVLLLIGWRGCKEAGHDEPQHVLMGRIMPALLETLEIPYEIVSENANEVFEAVRRVRNLMDRERRPCALIVRPGIFAKSPSPTQAKPPAEFPLSRARAIEQVVKALPQDSILVSTTGKASRELYFLRENQQAGHAHDLYVVGGMGCASSIALGIARKASPDHRARQVCVIDGDGAALMQLGSLATIGNERPSNLLHVIIDNASYESTGGQPSISPGVDFTEVARGCGYAWSKAVSDPQSLEQALITALSKTGPRLLVIRTNMESDPKLGRPSQSPRENIEGLRETLDRRS